MNDQLIDSNETDEFAAAIDEGEATETETQEPVTLEQVVDDLLTEFSDDRTFTPYGIGNLVNTVLEVFDVHKNGKPYRVRGQMLYNYCGNGMVVPGVKDTKLRANKEQVRAFLIRFVGGQLSK